MDEKAGIEPEPAENRARKRGPLRLLLLSLAAIWLLLGAALLALLGLELGLRGLFAVKDAIRPLPHPDPRVVQAGYDGAEWVPALYEEQERLEAEWAPYTGFRIKPFEGRFFRVNKKSERLTWQAEASDTEDPEVLILGGSSAWGLGARDEQTIPSHLSRRLQKAGYRLRVTNAAQVGHVQTQELVELLRRLQAGDRPRIVVFYDGVNDVLAAIQTARAGWPQNAANRQQEFNLLAKPGELLGGFVAATAQSSAFARLAGSAARRLGLERNEGSSVAEKYDSALADATLSLCASNMELIDDLAQRYGFTAVCCWQPVIFTKQSLTDYEREKAVQFAWLEKPMALTRERLAKLAQAQTSRVKFLDLTAVLDDQPGLIYVDFCHTTEAANARVAEVLVPEVAKLLELPSRDTGSDTP